MNSMDSLQIDQAQAKEYQYSYSYIEPLAMVDVLPKSENFSMPWLVLVGKQLFKLVVNTLIANQGDRGEPGVEDDVQKFLHQIFLLTLQEQGTSFKLKLISALKEIFPELLLGHESSMAASNLEGSQQPSLQATNVAQNAKVDVAVGVPKGVETALQQLLQEILPPTQTAPRTDTALKQALQNIQPTATQESVEVEVSENIKTALQQPLHSLPAQSSEVEQFVDSRFIQLLGVEFLKPFVKNVLHSLGKTALRGKADHLDRYRQLFRTLPLPEIANTFETDATFSYLRVAGPNPVMLERLSTLEVRFPVTEEQYQSVMGSADSLQRALAEGRVYLTDYGAMAGAVPGTYGTTPQTQKYTYAPLALFAVPPQEVSDRMLRPVAIQCGQDPAIYPVITPSTGAEAWQMAKTIVQIADANFHEAVSHFARTHLFIDPFVVATHRQLPANHPLFLLLVPHFQGTLAINYAAHEFLVAPQGGVNRLLSATIDSSRVLIVKGYQARGFNAEQLPRRLQEQGVDDPSQLPIYPYRDDALLVWEAIHDWVESYLRLFYATDADVTGDRDLQRWATELAAFEGGRLQDFGEDGKGKIDTLAYLIDAVTLIIFTASAQHAAVNFPQSGIMSFAPAMPTAGYQPVEAIATEFSGTMDWLDLLPPLEQAQAQLNLTYLLGSVYFTRLGGYDADHFSDPRVAVPLQAFQQRLQAIDAIIDSRNASRPKYEYLKPANIPQSINI